MSAAPATKSQPTTYSDILNFLKEHHSAFNVICAVVYGWLVICTISYGITQSTAVNSYGIQPGTPLWIEVLIAPAASIFYLAQLITYGSIHVCGTFSSPCAWPHTWPGPRPLENVRIFDDIWFSMFIFSFIAFFASSRSLAKSIKALSVPPIILGAILYFDDNHWFYEGFSTELSRFGFLTNENLMIFAICIFVVTGIWLKFSSLREDKKISK